MRTASGARPEAGWTLGTLAQTFGLDLRGGDPSSPVSGIGLDNRLLQAGEVFAALPGARTHGARFAGAATRAGAVAVLTDAAGAERIRADQVHVPLLVAPDPRAILGSMSSAVHGHPSRELNTYAVTGTNGKTTTTYLLEHILAALDRSTGLIGTVELKIADERTPARLTTPEATALHRWFASMRQAGVDDVVMEVSSHALSLHRVDGVCYDVAGFTNLSPDHLDFHHDLESYFAAKAELFTPERARRAVILVDDEWGRRLADTTQIPPVTVSTQGHDAHWQVRTLETTAVGTRIELLGPDEQSLTTTVGLPGAFNVANAALALVMAITAGARPQDIAEALPAGLHPAVPGRMELISAAPRVLVDFAHNTHALELALVAAREGTSGRLFVVFGATGDRDRTKRPHMGEVAVRGADVVIITDDDPHDEDPAAIRAQVLTGALAQMAREQRAGREVEVYEVAPRQAAIRRVVRFAAPADTVLVAGRGHETWQEIAGVDHHLDDRQEVRAAMAERGQHPGDGS